MRERRSLRSDSLRQDAGELALDASQKLDASQTLDGSQKLALLDFARRSIECGLRMGAPLEVDLACCAGELRVERATFVTLRKGGDLRGCVGSLEPNAALVEDAVKNAFGAAFQDPRFPRLREGELAALGIQVAILSPLVALPVASESDLLACLRPGVDGLVLSSGARRGTFLPKVWEQLPHPSDFVRELKRKAGLPADGWPQDAKVERYTVESVEPPS